MDDETTTFRPRPLYQALYTLPIPLALLILLDLLRTPAVEKWVVLTVIALAAAIAMPRGWARVRLEKDRLTLDMPLHQPRTVYLRQLIAVETSRRRWDTIILRYHPMDEQGRLDIANQEVLALVPLDQQYLLEERLRKVVGA